MQVVKMTEKNNLQKYDDEDENKLDKQTYVVVIGLVSVLAIASMVYFRPR